MITNLDIINYFFNENNLNKKKIKEYNNDKLPLNIKNYLDGIYNDSESLTEKLWRIKFNITIRPTCKYCGNKVKHISKNNYRTYCSHYCRNKDLFEINKLKTIEKYGTPFNRQKANETKIKLYGNLNYNNSKKISQTLLNKTKEEKKLINEKREQTLLKKYNVNNISQLEEIKIKKKNTCIEHYGVSTYLLTDDCKNKAKEAFQKNKDIIIKKMQNTCLKKYNVKAYNYNTAKKTKLLKYNDENYNNRPKYIETLLQKYGVRNVLQIPKIKEKVSKILSSSEIQNKINETKRKNNTFHTSKPESESYKLIKQKYSDVKYQYRSKEYLFNCDFYIPSINTYIECNYHWTHGGHPYNKNNDNDIELLKKWQSKNTKYYNNAIITWTIKDVEKRKTAENNNLNYIEFWNINELINWLEKIE